MAQYDSFLVRIWRNVGHEGPQWAARLEHLQSGEAAAVSTFTDLVEQLRTRAGPLDVLQNEPGELLEARVSLGTLTVQPGVTLSTRTAVSLAAAACRRKGPQTARS